MVLDTGARISGAITPGIPSGEVERDFTKVTLTQQKERVRELRKRWEVKHNEHMRKHGFERGFIDCRTLKEQGINSVRSASGF
ncbi:hypothetical protein ACLB1N_36685 [Escherichia coli]